MTKNTLLPYDSEQHTKGSELWDRRNIRNSHEKIAKKHGYKIVKHVHQLFVKKI